SRVATLDLRIRAGAAVESDVRASAEAFTAEVLRRCDDVLERRHPGRVWVARELALSLRLGGRAFADDREIEGVALALADSIEQDASGHLEAADASGDVAVFSTECAWRALHLETMAAREAAADWRFADLGSPGDAIAELAARPEGGALHDVLVFL